MIIYPAIDLYESMAVRLYKGDYNQKTIYSDNPIEIAYDFEKCGAERIHLVDLEGAKSGTTPNFDTIIKIKKGTSLFAEVGGGIRSMEVIKKYLDAGIDRVILGTAAVYDRDLLNKAVDSYKEKIAVGIDIKDGFVATKGWTEKSNIEFESFCREMQNTGIKTIIVTDISKDGAMIGTNREMYKELSSKLDIDIIASGGVSSIEDITALKSYNIHGAIIGKAYYTKALDLAKAIEVAK